MSDKIASHYRALLREHGDSAESAQYSSRETQERRFKYLIQIGSLDGARVLDFGCGTAHLATYLSQCGIRAKYTGVDVVEEFLEVAGAKHPGHRFGRFEEFSDERFDFVFVSGVFNNKRRGNRKFYQDSLIKLYQRCDRGLAFNMMSFYVDYRDPELFYENPERTFSFVKHNLTPFAVLRHDYAVKPETVPFEFIIYAYRNPPS